MTLNRTPAAVRVALTRGEVAREGIVVVAPTDRGALFHSRGGGQLVPTRLVGRGLVRHGDARPVAFRWSVAAV